MRVELVNPERQLLDEIADPRLKRADVALTYALAMRSVADIHWQRVNEAIIERWSMSALCWIKERAWRL